LPTARRRRSRRAEAPPRLKLGRTRRNGLAPALLVLLERGSMRNPDLLEGVRGRVVFRYEEGFTPTRIRFGPRTAVVEDGDVREPDLAISGSLPDIIHVAAAPQIRGLPGPHSLRGLIAIARVARGRVAIVGDRRLARQVLRLLAIES
jgi:hypothetical protein